MTYLDLDDIERVASAALLGPYASDQWSIMQSHVVALVARIRELETALAVSDRNVDTLVQLCERLRENARLS